MPVGVGNRSINNVTQLKGKKYEFFGSIKSVCTVAVRGPGSWL
jgi:hypothetical protein